MATSVNPAAISLVDLSITDTDLHTWRTNPWSTKTNTGIKLQEAWFGRGRQEKPYTIVAHIENSEDQELTAQYISNIDGTSTYGDDNIGGSASYPSGTNGRYVGYMQGPNASPAEYISLSLQFSTTPTSGKVIAFLLFYEGRYD